MAVSVAGHAAGQTSANFAMPRDAINAGIADMSSTNFRLSSSVGGAVTISTPPSATVPGAPTIGTATPGNAQATIAFTPPASNGGSPITGYTATCNPGALSANGAASPLTVTGLTNGLTYSCSVTATNAVGTSAPSASVNVTPVAPAPAFSASATTFVFSSQSVATTSTALTLTITNTGTAVLTLSAPTISGPFAVSANNCASVVPTATCAISVTFTPIIVGAATGQLRIATNVPATPQYVGSLSGNGTAAATAPGAPTIGSATPGNGQATIAFTPPASNGGSPITSYTATCTAPGQVTRTATGSGSPLTVVGLTAGVAYTCSLTATNGAGLTSVASGILSVTPATANNIVPLLLYLLD